MSKLRVNAPVGQAQAAAERWARLDAVLAASQATRQAAIAATNAAADAVDRPLIEEMDALRIELEGWFRRSGDQLTGGRRRSAELGGCMLGLRAGRVKLGFAGGDDKAALAALQEQRWAKPLIRVTYAVDRAGTLRALDGRLGPALAGLGFAAEGGEDAFHLARVEQPGITTPA